MGGQGAKARGIGYSERIAPTIKSVMSGGNTVPNVVFRCLRDGVYVENGSFATFRGRSPRDRMDVILSPKTIGALCANSHPGSYTGQDAYNDMLPVIKADKPPHKYIVRRLTPLECCRLQGFPEWWEDGVEGSDSSRYKMWGNGIALPCAVDVLRRIAKEAGAAECSRVRGRCSAGCKWNETAWERLAEYEDTGLTPETAQQLSDRLPQQERAFTLLKAVHQFIEQAGDQGSLAYLLGATVTYDDAECDIICLRDDIQNLLTEMGESV